MKKGVILVISFFVIVICLIYYFGNIIRNEKKVLGELTAANEKIQSLGQNLRKKCEDIGFYCYGNNVESTLDSDRKVNYDFVLKTQEICNECTKACLQVFGLEE